MLKTGTIALLFLSVAAYGATLHVPSQYPTIQSGINAAVDGDTVLVADGAYTGTGNKNLDFLGKAILVTSENGAETCIIDCQYDGRGFYFHSGEDSTSVLSGFTITHGNVDDQGGGIYCINSSPVISRNAIIANRAYYGGGICCESCFGPTIAHNLISSNSADGIGGGVYCLNVSGIAITNNTINQNDAFGIGGGIFCESSSPLISDNTINGNSVNALSGGGIYCDSCSSAMIIGNMIVGNGCMGSGGGIYCSAISDLDISANTINANGAGSEGGGIYCSSSNASISGNLITLNTSWGSGAGVHCSGNPIAQISENVVSGNTIPEDGSGNGGGICCINSNAQIISNMVNGNSISGEMGTRYGGGIYCTGANSNIMGNTISDNVLSSTSGDNAQCYGGGIYCSGSSATIMGNTINRNEASASGYLAGSLGGGIYFAGANSTIQGNTVYGNSAQGYFGLGGGIYCSQSSPAIINNTISGNSTLGSGYTGGGLYCSNSNPLVVNCVFWGNAPGQITIGGSSNPQVTYSDVQNGYTGTGNINTNPLFVNVTLGDYRLLWDSPCIDTGDPNPIYNDPDGTRADMGAWYYDQSMPVRLLLTPYNAPIQIPASGGSFQYAIQATNIDSMTASVLIWCDVTHPSAGIHGPVLGPLTIHLGAGETLIRLRNQNVPAGAPAGLYHYNAYAVAAGDTSEDSFIFAKLGVGSAIGLFDWANNGEALEAAGVAQEGIHPSSFIFHACHPNPFNPTTVLSFELRDASFVELRVFDISGRLVATLVDGLQDAGMHEVTFDGTDLSSGIYLAKITANSGSQTQKLILIK
ncbi:MAG TPA: right-handed parallel beta-helix repeat-containing protein [bacterium]